MPMIVPVCRLQTALAVPSLVFWPRVHTGRVHTGRARTCSLNRRPRYALGREHPHVPVVYNGAKILRDHHGPW